MEQSVRMKVRRCGFLTHPKNYQTSPTEPVKSWAQSPRADSRQEITLTRVKVFLDPVTENLPSVSHLTAQRLSSHVKPNGVLAGGFPCGDAGTQASHPVVPPALGILANKEGVEHSAGGSCGPGRGGSQCVCLFRSHSIGQNSVTWPRPLASSTREDLYLDSLQLGEVGSAEHVAISAPGLLL